MSLHRRPSRNARGPKRAVEDETARPRGRPHAVYTSWQRIERRSRSRAVNWWVFVEPQPLKMVRTTDGGRARDRSDSSRAAVSMPIPVPGGPLSTIDLVEPSGPAWTMLDPDGEHEALGAAETGHNATAARRGGRAARASGDGDHLSCRSSRPAARRAGGRGSRVHDHYGAVPPDDRALVGTTDPAPSTEAPARCTKATTSPSLSAAFARRS